MFQKLRLTPYERNWNDYYDSEQRRGVLLRRYPYSVTLSNQTRVATIFHRSGRRARVCAITFSGDVSAVRFQSTDSTGETYQINPMHLPLLCGAGVFSTAIVNTSLYPAYPTSPALQTTPIIQAPPAFTWSIDPNIVLPGSKQLQLAFSMEDPNDARAADSPYLISLVVVQWEFPGFEGGAT